MNQKIKPFKQPPKKYQPQGTTILYEDRDILVVNKAHGLLTISKDGKRDRSAFSALTSYVKKGNYKSKNRIFLVHHLEKDMSGLLVFAKTPEAKRFLQENWQKFNHTFLVVVHGEMEKKAGSIQSYLVENQAHRMYSSNDSDEGLLAKTHYRVLNTSEKYSRVEVKVHTSVKNQIRVHFADLNHPVVGDKKYGEFGKGKLAIHSTSMTLLHPFSKEKLPFEVKLPKFMKDLV